ncbi:MAG: hypothetical protein E7168_04220 [Firmicutes bacterium]|nr:hypothetical protein [Bacillota bacterium]
MLSFFGKMWYNIHNSKKGGIRVNKLEELKRKKLEKILENLSDYIDNENDLLAGEEPSVLFYLLADKLGYLLEHDVDKTISKETIETRRKLHFIIKTLGPYFLSNPQIIENRNKLLNPDSKEEDKGIILPDEPVIWVANHAFKDDTLASILAAYRHAYILFGSVPQFYNTFDGITAWLNGVVMTNRKVDDSKRVSVKKATKVIENGTDLLVFPEGVWNKTPDLLLLDLWPGIYRIAKETGAKVVPIAHYINDCSKKGKSNPIHTVIDEPLKIDDMSEKEALTYVRDTLASWQYLMMEQYGKTTREKELFVFNNSKEYWEHQLEKRVKTAARYDKEIEYTADYRPKWITRPEQAFESIANVENITIENIHQILDAKKLVKTKQTTDYQRRF